MLPTSFLAKESILVISGGRLRGLTPQPLQNALMVSSALSITSTPTIITGSTPSSVSTRLTYDGEYELDAQARTSRRYGKTRATPWKVPDRSASDMVYNPRRPERMPLWRAQGMSLIAVLPATILLARSDDNGTAQGEDPYPNG